MAHTQGAADQVLMTMLEWPQTLRIDAVAWQDDDPLLGFVMSPGGSHWRPTPRKFWRVAITLRSLACSRVPRSGLQIKQVLGHTMSLFGLRREFVAIFAHGYLFASRFQHKATRVWPSVRREFKRAGALLPLCVAGLDRAWDGVVHACDASSSGVGVVQRVLPVE